MTLRIVLRAAAGEPVLALHGWLAGAEVAEFERLAAGTELPLSLDLESLSGADEAGVAALCTQRLRGVRLTKASPYIALLLRARAGGRASEAPGGPEDG
jgi:hypothetical protein